MKSLFSVLVFLPMLSIASQGVVSTAPDLNQMIVRIVRQMPLGGGYDLGDSTKALISQAITWQSDRLLINPTAAHPSFCTGATYLVFARLLAELKTEGYPISELSLRSLLASATEADGHFTFGRWNSNGPATAKFFSDIRAGRSFIDEFNGKTKQFSHAKPGDFLKIFWRNAKTGSYSIGKSEAGHSVIYLGIGTSKAGKSCVRYWSSQTGSNGMGTACVDPNRIGLALFSRLVDVSALNSISVLPNQDPFLASMLVRDITVDDLGPLLDPF